MAGEDSEEEASQGGSEMDSKKPRCPKCSTEMSKITRHGVTIDKCMKCKGLWLDKGEMEKLLKLGK